MQIKNTTIIPKTHRFKSKTYRGFTLVELIVVITILVILGTIAFVSLSGYSGSARDGSRVSDLANLSKGIDIAYIKSSSYPIPDNSFTVTYSGWVLWHQGTIGDNVTNMISTNGAKMSKKPMDPLNTTKEYTYSKLAYGNAYQIKSDWEGDTIAYLPSSSGLTRGSNLAESRFVPNGSFGWIPAFAGMTNIGIPEAQAASGNPTFTYIKGNYNGMVAKTQTGNIIYLLAVPSIITSQTGTTGQSFDIVSALSNKLFIHGQTNSGGVAYMTDIPQFLIYSSGALPSSDTERKTFATNLALAYSGTVLTTHAQIQSFITAVQDNNTGSLVNLGGGMIASSLGGGAGTIVNDTPLSIAAYSSGTIYAIGQSFVYNGATVTVTGSWYGSVHGTKTLHAPACDTDDIAVFTGSLIQIWAACNAGANTAYIPEVHGWSGVIMSTVLYGSDTEPNRKLAYSGVINNTVNFLGNYYQWGRNDPVNLLGINSLLYDAEYQTGGFSINGSGFLSNGSSMPFSWITVAKHETSSGVIWTDNQFGKNGPCSPGYHVPTGDTDVTARYEWYTAYVIANSMPTLGSCSQTGTTPPYDRLRCALRIPLAGYRGWSAGTYTSQGMSAIYWSSSPNSLGFYNADNVRFSNGGGSMSVNNFRSHGYSVRCIRN